MKVGVILPSADDRDSGRSVRYQEIRAWALSAESAGFDSVWVYDHLLVRRPGLQLGVWEGWTILSALAEATTTIELGSWVMCVPFRNPALLAKMATTLDEVSAGRLILGLGAGNQRPEFEAFGYDFENRFAQFREGMDVIEPLLRTGAVEFSGEYYSARDCEIRPRGPRDSGPPILIGASGPRMLRLAARYADLWNGHYLGDPNNLIQLRVGVDAACESVNRDPTTLGSTIGEWVAFPDLHSSPSGIDTVPGSHQALVELLGRYQELGVDHLMLQCSPARYEAALERLGTALEAHRRAAARD